MGATIGDGLRTIGICLCIVGCLFLITQCMLSTPEFKERSDYQECIHRCPEDWSGNFKGYECPTMCEKLRDCSNFYSHSPEPIWATITTSNETCKGSLNRNLTTPQCYIQTHSKNELR